MICNEMIKRCSLIAITFLGKMPCVSYKLTLNKYLVKFSFYNTGYINSRLPEI